MAFYVYIIMQPKAMIIERKHWMIKNKNDITCILFDRSMEVQLHSLLGNYDRPINRRTDCVIGKLHFKLLKVNCPLLKLLIPIKTIFIQREFLPLLNGCMPPWMSEHKQCLGFVQNVVSSTYPRKTSMEELMILNSKERALIVLFLLL